jgi:hypothetical protein
LALAIAGVADESPHHSLLPRRKSGKADVDRERAPVASPASQLQAEAHRTRCALLGEGSALELMGGSKLFGDEHLDLLTDDFVRFIAEQATDCLTGHQNDPVEVDDYHRVRRRLQELGQMS